MRSVLNPRAGVAATGLFLGGLAISAAVALVTAPITPRLAIAQTAAPTARPSTPPRVTPASLETTGRVGSAY